MDSPPPGCRWDMAQTGATMTENHAGSAALSTADALWRLYQFDFGETQGEASAETRSALTEAVGQKLMMRYEYNQLAKTSHPVTRLEDGRCPDCGTQYPACHDLAKLSGSGKVRGCYTCGRLITFVTLH